MLLIKHVHLQNFMSIEELDLDFDENEVVAVCGQNGSGKSSLLYAIAFLLTGYRKGESYRDYVRTGCESSYLYLEAFLNGEPLYCEAELLGQAKKNIMRPTTRKTVYKGVTYLNSDHNQFIKQYELDYVESLVFFFQDSGKDIIDARPSERASALKRLFKFEFNDIVEKLKEEQEQNKISKIETTTSIEDLKSRNFETSRLSREVLPCTKEQWENRSKEITRLLIQIGDVNVSRLNEIEKELEITVKKIKDTQNKYDRENQQVLKLEKEIEERKKSLEGLNKDIIDEKLKELKESLDKHRLEYEQLQNKANEVSSQINLRLFKKNELDGQIKISRGGICHACGQAIDENHINDLIRKRDEVEKEIKELNDKLTLLYFDKDNAKEKKLLSRISEMERKREEYQRNYSSLDFSKKKLEALISLQEEREKYIKELEASKSKLLIEKENLANTLKIVKEKDTLTKELHELEEKSKKAEEERIRNIERKRNNEKVLLEKEECEKRIKDLNEKLNSLLLSINTTKVVADVFENSFPSFLILQATQRLEDYINEVVQRIFPYMRVKLQMQRSGVTFIYTAESSEEEWIPVSMASGAQKAVLSLAYKTSLARLYGISCIMLDEVDASCTIDNAKIIYKFIASLNCFQQLIFISHRPESIEAAKEVNDAVVVYKVEKGEYVLVER